MVCTEMGLGRVGDNVPVAQRLKRREQIINKLARLDSMRLWTMGDIGGCRAVLESREQRFHIYTQAREPGYIHGSYRWEARPRIRQSVRRCPRPRATVLPKVMI